MRKKIIVLSLAILILIIGWIYIGIYAFGTQGTYYGFINCGQKEKLNYFHQFLIFEVVFFVILLLLGLRHIYFLPFKNRSILYYTTALILINLLFITYRVIEYPIIYRSYSFLSASGENTSQNPLFVISIMHAAILTVYLFTFLKNTMALKFRLTTFLIPLAMIITETIIVLSTNIKPCFG